MWTHPALSVFEKLPLRERFFVRGRLFTAPLERVASEVKGPRILDVGCGHGLLCAMMAFGFPERSVVGLDVDPRKMKWARRSVGQLSNTRFELMPVEQFADVESGGFDTITVADVLYLLPPSSWAPFFEACFRLLAPRGQLLVKEVEDDGGWRTHKALFQEQLMVRVLRRTHTSGGLGVFPRDQTIAALRQSGFELRDVVTLSRKSSTPHVLFIAEKV